MKPEPAAQPANPVRRPAPGLAWLAPVRAIAGKDLRDLARERSILAALLVQFFLAAFSAFLTVGLLGLYDPSSVEAFPSAEVAYAGPAQDSFLATLSGADNLRVEVMPGPEAVAAFRAGTVAAVVEEIQPDGPGGVRHVSLLLAEGTIQSTLLLTQFKSMLADYELALRLQAGGAGRLEAPVLHVPEGDAGRVPYAFVYGTLVPLLFITPVFLSGAIAGDAVVQDVQRGTLAVLRSGPVTARQILAAKLLVPVALAPAQFLLWCLLLAWNGLPVAHAAGLAALAAAMAALVAAGGMAVAARLRREGPTQAAYAACVLLAGLASLWLPHDPFSMVARLATGSTTPSVLWTAAAWALAGLVAVAVALPYAARCLVRDATPGQARGKA